MNERDCTMLICSFSECDKPVLCKGLCSGHYKQTRRGVELAPLREIRNTSADLLEALNNGTMICSRCGLTKPLDQFSKSTYSKYGVHNNCRSCQSIAAKKGRYNLTETFMAELFKKQGSVCAICQTTDPGGLGWHTDHDHNCCKGYKSCGDCVRGFLCGKCNRLLGNAEDDVERLLAAIDYLNSPPAQLMEDDETTST